MKILQLTYALEPGGAEHFVVDLSNQLSENPTQEVILCSIVDDTAPTNRHYLPELSKRVRYVCLGCASGYAWDSPLKVLRFIQREKPDVVHAHCNATLLYLPSLLYRKCSYVYTLHNLANECIGFKLESPLNKMFLKRRICSVTISDRCEMSFKQMYPGLPVTCIPNGRSPIKPTDRLSEVRAEIERLKNSSADKVFINVARCGEAKNHKMLFEAFDELTKTNSHLQLIVLGNGFEDSPLWAYCKHPHIHILGLKDNVGDYLLCANFFILSSLWEGLPISLLEAMSCGLIPVCTPAGGIPDVVTDGQTGFLSPSFQKVDFIQTIKRALVQEHMISHEQIKKVYETCFSMKACADKYVTVYKGLVGGK